eukprot:Rmarinus@m.14820
MDRRGGRRQALMTNKDVMVVREVASHASRPAGIRHAVQERLFGGGEEQVLCSISAMQKKEKKLKEKSKEPEETYLVVTLKSKQKVRIHKVVRVENAKKPYENRKTWKAEDLVRVDDIRPRSRDPSASTYVSAEFMLQFSDKQYRWACHSLADKMEFLWCVFSLWVHHIGKNLPSGNISVDDLTQWAKDNGLEDSYIAPGEPGMDSADGDVENEPAGPSLSMTAEEEKAIVELLQDEGLGVNEATDFGFGERLQHMYNTLEAENVRCLLGSHHLAVRLGERATDTIKLMDEMEQWLAAHNEELTAMRRDIQEIEGRNNRFELQRRNYQSLAEELSSLLKRLTVTRNVKNVLFKGELTDGESLKPAAEELVSVLHEHEEMQAGRGFVRRSSEFESLPDGPGLTHEDTVVESDTAEAVSKLAAVIELRDDASAARDQFVDRVKTELRRILCAQAEAAVKQLKSLGQRASYAIEDLSAEKEVLTEHCLAVKQLIYDRLFPYRQAVHTLGAVAPSELKSLRREYGREVRPVYHHIIRSFFGLPADAKGGGGSGLRSHVSMVRVDSQILRMTSALGHGRLKKGIAANLLREHGGDDDSGVVSPDQVFWSGLKGVIPMIKEERSFVVDLFFPDFAKSLQEDLPETNMEGEAGTALRRASLVDKEKQRVFDEEVNHVLDLLFDEIVNELKWFVDIAEKYDRMCVLRMLSDVDRIPTVQTGFKSSYTLKIVYDLHGYVKNIATKFVESVVQDIKEFKETAKRCGVLLPTRQFPVFVIRAEAILTHGHRNYTDQAYHDITDAVFQCIEGVANSDEKYKEIVRMENYRHFYRSVGALEVKSLQQKVQLAKTRAEKAQQEYIKWVVSCAFTRLFQFFADVEAELKSTSPEDVQFQTAFTKQNMQKVVYHDTSIDFIKRLVDGMWKRVTKHLQKDEDFAAEVWEQTADYLTAQFTHFESVLWQCYPGEQFQVDVAQIPDIFQGVIAS